MTTVTTASAWSYLSATSVTIITVIFIVVVVTDGERGFDWEVDAMPVIQSIELSKSQLLEINDLPSDIVALTVDLLCMNEVYHNVMRILLLSDKPSEDYLYKQAFGMQTTGNLIINCRSGNSWLFVDPNLDAKHLPCNVDVLNITSSFDEHIVAAYKTGTFKFGVKILYIEPMVYDNLFGNMTVIAASTFVDRYDDYETHTKQVVPHINMFMS
ncbi:hypothetical protein BC830DRAFT_1221898 [Chytriomyces sp. MP71]|nr:hypothetical protein BC830DRAFT_1221898 [Chytriomyces sp. MP71]